METRDRYLTAAICLSVALHAAVLSVADYRSRNFRIHLPPLHRPENSVTLSLAPPLHDPFVEEEVGDRTGTGTGSNSSDGATKLQAKQADEDQPLLSREPQGPGKMADAPSPTDGPPGERGKGGQRGGPSAGAVAAPASKPPLASDQPEPPKTPAITAKATDPAVAPPSPRQTASTPPKVVETAQGPTPEPAPRPVAQKVPDSSDTLKTPAEPLTQTASAPELPDKHSLLPPILDPEPQPAAPPTPSAPAPATPPRVQLAMVTPVPPAIEVRPSPPVEVEPSLEAAVDPAKSTEKAVGKAVDKAAIEPTPAAPQTPQRAVAQPATGDGLAPGRASHADPAQQSDSESDAFTKVGVAVFHNGKLSIRSGRKVRTVRPKLLVPGILDVIGARNPTVLLKINIDPSGKVAFVEVLESSGSNDIDQPVVVAVYDWWFEPARDRAGNPISDTILFSIGFR